MLWKIVVQYGKRTQQKQKSAIKEKKQKQKS